jgi:hypothetical protein
MDIKENMNEAVLMFLAIIRRICDERRIGLHGDGDQKKLII